MPEANVSPPSPRKEFRNIQLTQLLNYRFPLPSIVSILHRISGGLLFLLLPFLLYLLEQSLTSELSFEEFQAFISGWFVRLVITLAIWAYLHHFCAGIRHLFQDFHVGLEKHQATKTALAILVLSLGLTLVLVLKLFGAY